MLQSFEPGEDWFYDYRSDKFFEGPALAPPDSHPPDQPVPGQPFAITPAQATLYRVGVHWALGDAGAALNAGKNLHPSQFPTPERRGRLHTDLARAWWQWNKPDQTAGALLAAYQQAPTEITTRPAIRQIAINLTRHHPKAQGAQQLATILHKTGKQRRTSHPTKEELTE